MIEPVYKTIDEAIARGDLDDVHRHLLAWPLSVNRGKHPKLSPLNQAILRKKEAIAMFLIEAGANVDLADANNRTPLHLTVERNLPKVAEALLSLDTRLTGRWSGSDVFDRAGWNPPA
jgi:ankyrin repeat protein